MSSIKSIGPVRPLPSSPLAPFTGIDSIQQGLLSGQITALGLCEALLRTTEQSKTNASLTTMNERALKQAREADALIRDQGAKAFESKKLLGIPMGIKDLLTIEDEVTTCGSRILEGYKPPYTATAVRRLDQAGAVLIQKLNMDEFAMGGSNENSAYGPVLHPRFPDRVPGGSSGGSATAVKEGLCIASLGSDTGGSVRLPASFCGIVGSKPTYGRISRYGLIAFASSLDQIGPMTCNVKDNALLTEVMSGHDPLDSTSAPVPSEPYSKLLEKKSLNGLRVGLPSEYFDQDGMGEATRAAIQNSLDHFKSAGAQLVPIRLPHSPFSVAVYYILAVSEASSNLARFDGVKYGVRPPKAKSATDLVEFYKETRALFGAEVKRRIILGTFALSSGYYDAYYNKACQVRRLIQNDFLKAFEQVDVIAGPVCSDPAFRIGENTSDPLKMYMNDLYTIPVNLAGLPALSVPCAEDANGLPIGLHLIGKPWDEANLFSIAHQFETLIQGGRS
jgi:aspartyl-tRNA(Asn)/glutamyl-tRNA(Gln) amidotransferase subunit A